MDKFIDEKELKEIAFTKGINLYQLYEYKKSLLFRSTWLFEEPSIEDLKRLKKLIDSTIKNYNDISLSLKQENELVYDKLFPTTRIKRIEEPRIPKPGTVYVVNCKRTGLYKIGFTASMESRFKSIKTHNPNTTLVSQYDNLTDAQSVEKELHILFKDKKSDGEWFELNECDLETINRKLDPLY
jgi:predicted GIY-YIG superfamily endonuclease